MARAAAAAGPIILTGEEGGGRAHTAVLIHEASRKPGRFMSLECRCTPESLQVAELFGAWHAVSGSLGPGVGRIERAAHGILCIRSAELLTDGAQSALLRFLTSETVQ